MDCKEFRESLDLYIDGELSSEATFSARAHLDGCAGCSGVAQRLGLLRSELKRVVNAVEPPAELVHDVRRLVRPKWRQLIPQSRTGQTGITGVEKERPFWRKNIPVPAPLFALLLMTLLAAGVWTISMQPVAQSPRSVTGAKKVMPPSLSPGPMSEFDLAQFDRGERPAIYKVRLTDYRTQKP